MKWRANEEHDTLASFAPTGAAEVAASCRVLTMVVTDQKSGIKMDQAYTKRVESTDEFRMAREIIETLRFW